MIENDLKAEDESFKKNYEARAKANLAQEEQQIKKSLQEKLEKDEKLFQLAVNSTLKKDEELLKEKQEKQMNVKES